MSSNYTNRYQSKLFNFVHQQYRRLTAQWENGVRQLQATTMRGVETLLYQLFPLDISPGKRLQAQTPPSVDAPIQRVLETVKNSSLTTTTNPIAYLVSFFRPNQSTATINHNLPMVQGIAINLENRHLVLVTRDNQILNILTPQQQAKLAARITEEVAEYRRFQLKEAHLLPEINRILANLTGSNYSLNPGGVLIFLDATIARWEAQSVTTQTLNIQALIEAALNYFFGDGKERKIESKPNNYVLPPDSQPADSWLTWGDLYGNQIDQVNKSGFQSPIAQARRDNNNQIESKPDWIEITATLLGYEKHPLEQLLQWLDHAMLWLEQLLLNIFYFLRGLLRVR